MRLFWRHGYEGVSINDLTNAIGIAPPSLYAAFGSKAGLYREALDHYGGLPGALSDLDADETLEGTVSRLLRNAVDAVTDPRGEGGCMVSTGMIQCAREHAELASDVADRRRGMHATITGALKRWLDDAAAVPLARFLVTVLQGLSVQARDGATRSDLDHVVEEVVGGVMARIRSGELRVRSQPRLETALNRTGINGG
ncbi:helix-turn-helix transcriptional regulator [Azospirillum sp. RWY-5-1]|uniref:Helix-turn-helix transcriptional regulator n=1 Tax=Azospirillum oleiclasticum TaxID=2735135 RepID=A0ABX2TKP5_9PROT|nr:TetR/AcrR family transcriptional regulator [Azospirillum oleiclasticum]NYZ14438.1 helix-turn-helix transcriptional regulator [Azospirillum oleiclasticum]NYZ23210.1 helix-turn-helix transcriptional regulator [Azospirillum oleiclasticum]